MGRISPALPNSAAGIASCTFDVYKHDMKECKDPAKWVKYLDIGLDDDVGEAS
jgi:hypothetical protein